MMKISAIKAQVKNPDRVSIYVDGKFAFSLNHAQLLDLKLHSGLELDEAKLEAFKKVSAFGKMFDRVLNYLMIRTRSRREVEDYCRRKKWDPAECAVIIEKLTARGYLDDRAFARAWVESRHLTKAMSERRLRLELRQKGVADDIIAEVLQASEYNERTALVQLVAKKRRQVRYQDQQKLMQYLARQGFAFDDIKQVLNED
jgi:regulatory protein